MPSYRRTAAWVLLTFLGAAALPAQTVAPRQASGRATVQRTADTLRLRDTDTLRTVSPRASITIGFDRDVTTWDDTTATRTPPVRLEPAIPFITTWRDAATLRVTPMAPLLPGQRYRVVIDTPYVAIDRARLVAPATVDIAVPPAIRRDMLPRPYERDTALIDPRGRIRLVMSGPVDSARWAHAVTVRIHASAHCTPAEHRYVLVQQRLPQRGEWASDIFARDVEGTRRFDTLTRVLEFAPEVPLPEDCAARLEVPDRQRGVAASDREPTPAPEYHPVRTAPPFRLAPLAPCGESPCVVPSLAHVNFTLGVQPNTESSLRLDPPARSTLTSERVFAPRSAWTIPTSAEAGDTVRFTADSLLRDIFDRPLAGATSWTSIVPDRTPDARLLDAGLVQRPRTPRDSVAVLHVNASRIELRAVRVKPSVFHATALANDWPRRLSSSVTGDTVRVVYDLKAPRNAERTSWIRIPDAIMRDQQHAWLLEVRLLRTSNRVSVRGTPWSDSLLQPSVPRPMLLMFSDLAVHAHLLGMPSAVFVTDVQNGAPVADATVHLLDSSRVVLAAARTRPDGTAVLGLSDSPLLWRTMRERADLLEVAHDADTLRLSVRDRPSLLPLALAGNKSAFDWSRVAYDETPWSRSVAFSDRELYGAGDRLYFGLIRRAWTTRGPESSAGDSVRWYARAVTLGSAFLTAPFDSGSVRLSEEGVAADSLRVPRTMTPSTLLVTFRRFLDGAWRDEATVRARVAEYRVPEFDVRVAASESRDTSGAQAAFAMTARYLHDAPMTAAPVRWTLALEEQLYFLAPRARSDGWHTGPWWGSEGIPQRRLPQHRRSGTATLDSSGSHRVHANLAVEAFRRPVLASLNVTVTDVTRQEVNAHALRIVHPSLFYLSARREARPDDERATTPVQIMALDTTGAPRGGVLVQAALVQWRRDDRTSETNRQGTAPLDTIWRASVDVIDSLVRVDVPVPARGVYELVLSARDSLGQDVLTSIDVSRSRPVIAPAPVVAPTANLLRVEQDDVPSGTPADVTFDSAFEDAEAWLTLDREGTLWQWRARVTRGTHRVQVPTTNVPAGGAYLSLLLVPRDDALRRHHPDAVLENRLPSGRRWQFASIPLRVGDATSRLSVQVTSRKTRWAPSDTAELDFVVQDAAHEGVAARLVVWAVDEGLLALSGYQTPDPHDVLRRVPRPLMPALTSLWGVGGVLARGEVRAAARQPWFLRPEYRDFNGRAYFENAAGGIASRAAGLAAGLPTPEAREDFRPTAFFAATVRTDPTGRARLRAALPQGVTRYRVFALAVDVHGRAGRDSTTLQVYTPLVVRAAMPRFVRPGDAFRAGLAVSSADAQSRAVRASVQTHGLTPATATRDLPRAASARTALFAWQVPPGAPDRVAVSLHAVAADAADGVRITLPVSRVARPFVASRGALLESSATRIVTLPRDADLSSATLTVSLGTGLRGALAIAAHRAQRAGGTGLEPTAGQLRWLASQAPAHVDSLAHAAWQQAVRPLLDRLSQRITPNGRVTFWPGVDVSSTWWTAYTALVLAEVEGVGAALPREVRERVREALYFSEVDTLAPVYGTLEERVTQVRQRWSTELLRALARRALGDADTMLEASVRAHAADLAWEDLPALAELLHAGGRTDDARDVLTSAWRAVRADSISRLQWPEDVAGGELPSPLRGPARLLRATTQIAPDHPRLSELSSAIAPRLATSATMHDVGWVAAALPMPSDAEITPSSVRLARMDGSGRVDTLRVEADTRERSSVAAATTAGRLTVSVPAQSYARLFDTSPTTQSLAVTVATDAPSYAVLQVEAPARRDARAAQSNGLTVERHLERLRDGQRVQRVEVGTVLRVVLRVRTSATQHFVRLEDALPAGFEPIDASLRTTTPVGDVQIASRLQTLRDLAPDDFLEGGNGTRWRAPFQLTPEVRNDAVTFMARTLSPGVHTVSYLVRATTAGRFVYPSALVVSELDPEVSGRTATTTLVISDPPPASSVRR